MQESKESFENGTTKQKSHISVGIDPILCGEELLRQLKKEHPEWELRLAPKNPEDVQRKIGKTFQKICSHGKQRSECKECGGSSICSHGKRRSRCKECGGGSICSHGKQRSQCKECGGSSICSHGKYKSYCKECGGSSLCPCGEHFKQKNGFCAACLKCTSEGCPGIPSQTFKYDYCYPCGCTLIGRTPQQKRQDKVFQFIEENYKNCEIRYDQIVPNQNCNKFRPDVLFQLPHRNLIIECDEDSHKAEQYSCETKRMSEIAAAGEFVPTVFIRFNPDIYRNPEGLKKKIPLEKRFETLKKEIDYWLDLAKEQEHFVTVIYLFYDHSEEREEGFVPVDLQELEQSEDSLQDSPVLSDEENPNKRVKTNDQ